ncbi:hypothetical protein [Sinomonas halotolerans]|uniref:Lipoprotein with Yx(FWY)xxD motif n=1 Tax=Sinomonas halotolerans TaxID=1644133 RepID=A0ABU9X2L5_9MICC
MDKRAALLLAAAAASALALAGCAGGGGGTTATGTTPAPAASASSPSGGAEALRTSTVGDTEILVDDEGWTVYYYTRDNAGEKKSACTGGCADLWPAVTSEGAPKLEGVTAEVGSIATEDGKQQVTVNGMPVYYYAKDTAPGQVNGQGVAGVWYVVGPDGTMVQTQLSPAATPAPTQTTGGMGY